MPDDNPPQPRGASARPQSVRNANETTPVREMFIRAGIDPAEPEQAQQFAEVIRWAIERYRSYELRQQRRQQAIVWLAGAIGTAGVTLGAPVIVEWLRRHWP